MIVHFPRMNARRLAAGGITIGVHLLLLVMLLALGRYRLAWPRSDVRPTLMETPLASLPPRNPPRHRASPRKASAQAVAVVPVRAAPSSPLTAPPPIVPLSLAAPVMTGPSGSGGDSAGAGAGAGGDRGGSGGNGAGDGIPPARIGGHIHDSDYPASLSAAGISGTVSVRYRVGTNGRASDCVVTHSSGSDALDRHTCDLIERRFRFRPSRDADGRPVSAIIVENHSWIISAAAPADVSAGGGKAPYSQR